MKYRICCDQEISLVECAVSDEALEVLGKNCPNLVSLNVSEDRKKKLITDEVHYTTSKGTVSRERVNIF
jgi:hypothetical protein